MTRAWQTNGWTRTVITIVIGTLVAGVASYLVWVTRCSLGYDELRRRVDEVEKQIPILHRRITEATR